MFKNFAVALSSAALLVGAIGISADAQTTKVTKRKTTHSGRIGRGSYFVPPPPPYQPSILPEMNGASASISPAVQAPKPENPYSKYVYTRNAADAPTIIQPNRYVTVWNK
ncbi:MAG TPA: hypothetical protein V6C81_17265 [Planktothrix sp.]